MFPSHPNTFWRNHRLRILFFNRFFFNSHPRTNDRKKLPAFPRIPTQAGQEFLVFSLSTLVFASFSRFFQQVEKDLFPEFSSPTFLLCSPRPRFLQNQENLGAAALGSRIFQEKNEGRIASFLRFCTKPVLILLSFLEFQPGIPRSFLVFFPFCSHCTDISMGLFSQDSRTRRISELQLWDQKFPGIQDKNKQNSCPFSQFLHQASPNFAFFSGI